MLRPTAACVHRFRVKSSVFVTELHPARSAAERASVLSLLRERHADATHRCVAWRQCGSAWGLDDDGEVSGTAGGPMLRVMDGSGLVESIAVCARWYGGTKLGVGGLVRAYTEGMQGALDQARKEGLLEPAVQLVEGRIVVPPQHAHIPYAVLASFADATVTDQVLDEHAATLTFRVSLERKQALETAWRDRSRGGQVEWIES